ncbi:hypothetical protein [Streptomyces canus]|uniref:hypothetical protein n=1 Tax=Streptomyces canus TaxID=58343 RepID=UPI0003806298|nr:hypothetical protein [Streptomyces canus]
MPKEFADVIVTAMVALDTVSGDGAGAWSASSRAARRMGSPPAGDIRLLQILAINGDMGEVAIAVYGARVRTVRQSR